MFKWNGLKAFFLVGPTAVGKTAVSQWIAERQRFDILSADAMLVYRGLDIGTAKPSPAWRQKVRYWGLDLVGLAEHFSVGQYRAYACEALRAATAAGRRMIITGGTGLYVKSLTHGLLTLPRPDAALRAAAAEIFQAGGLAALQAWARSQAPELYAAIADKKNPRRLMRAVEIAQSSPAARPAPWKQLGQGPLIVGLAMPMEKLYERIAARVEEMYAGGLLAEVAELLPQGLEQAPTAGKAIGYAEAISFLKGKMTRAAAVQETIRRTRHLAKRQMTWFKNQANVDWLDASQPAAQTAQMVWQYWEKSGPTPIK